MKRQDPDRETSDESYQASVDAMKFWVAGVPGCVHIPQNSPSTATTEEEVGDPKKKSSEKSNKTKAAKPAGSDSNRVASASASEKSSKKPKAAEAADGATLKKDTNKNKDKSNPAKPTVTRLKKKGRMSDESDASSSSDESTIDETSKTLERPF